MKLKYILYFISLLLISQVLQVQAATKISIPDTVAYRSVKTLLPVYGTFDTAPSNKLEIKLRYDARILDINTAKGDNSYFMREANINILYDYTDLANAVVTIRSQSVNSMNEGILCLLEIEGLVFQDSVTNLVPVEIFINDIKLVDFEADSSIITVPGPAIFKETSSGIGYNYPNPFSWKTVFPITLKDSTKIKFRIYSSAGELRYSSDKKNNDFRLMLKDDNGNIEISELNKTLAPGSYELELIPTSWMIPSGAYYMVMKTNNNVYNTNFILKKE